MERRTDLVVFSTAILTEFRLSGRLVITGSHAIRHHTGGEALSDAVMPIIMMLN